MGFIMTERSRQNVGSSWPEALGKAVVCVFIVYYVWLLPLLAVVTAYFQFPSDADLGAIIFVGLIPVVNWIGYLSLLTDPASIGLSTAGPLLALTKLWAVFGMGVIALAFLAIMKINRWAAEAEAEAEEVARLQRHREEQEGYRNQIVVFAEESIVLFESMPEHLTSAEKWLDQAAADFAEGAFAPFWDSVENAANWLAHFDEGIRQIKDKSSRYTELIGKYEDTPPKFPIAPQSVEKLGVGTVTSERMKAIVRTAQRNFQFATIYEQRKTNQILVAGFKTLAEALEQMTRQIMSSLDALADSVNTRLRAIDSRLDEIAAMSTQHHAEMMEELSEIAARERQAVEMLDNIQHRRRPFP